MENKKNNNGIIILLMTIIIIILGGLCVLFATGTIGLKSNTNDNKNTQSEESGEVNNIEEVISNEENNSYSESYVGYYQILNDNFMESKTDSTQYTKIDLEYYLKNDNTFEVAYRLLENGNVTTKKYSGTYEISKVLDEEINGDHYVALNMSYTSQEALNDEVISMLSTNVTYNPASDSTDSTEQSFPKHLVIRGPLGKMHTYKVEESEIKYLK